MSNINQIELNGTTYDLEDAGARASSGLTNDIKDALLACFEKVAWIDSNGQNYYDALESALYPPANLSSISCVYTQSGAVYTIAPLDYLKSDLVVTALWSDNTTSTITNYILSGTLTEGTSIITVSYGGKTTTFTVTVTEYTTSPTITNTNMGYNTSGVAVALSGFSTSLDSINVSSGTGTTYKYVAPKDADLDTTGGKIKIVLFYQGALVDYFSMGYADASSTPYSENSFSINADVDQIGFTLATNHIEDSYAYISNTGDIIFAGRNTDYYGKSNIND